MQCRVIIVYFLDLNVPKFSCEVISNVGCTTHHRINPFPPKSDQFWISRGCTILNGIASREHPFPAVMLSEQWMRKTFGGLRGCLKIPDVKRFPGAAGKRDTHVCRRVCPGTLRGTCTCSYSGQRRHHHLDSFRSKWLGRARRRQDKCYYWSCKEKKNEAFFVIPANSKMNAKIILFHEQHKPEKSSQVYLPMWLYSRWIWSGERLGDGRGEMDVCVCMW